MAGLATLVAVVREGSDVRFGSLGEIAALKRQCPKADICSALAHVCFVPKADIRKFCAYLTLKCLGR